MATKTNWKELYQDLPENIATILRDARVKPEQLKEKSDGDLLSLSGITDANLETIRTKYPAASVEEVKQEKKEEVKEATKTSNKNSPFYKHPRYLHGRSHRYQTLTKKVKKDHLYPILEAIKTLQSLSTKVATIDAHLNVTETGLRGEAKTPFSTGKTVKVEVFSEKTITALNENKINFDILIATPADMPKLARFAKILGPKGLMPNPKNGTIVADPEARAKQLSTGSTLSYRTEPKFPIMHVSIGKTNQKLEEISANLTTLIKDIGVTKVLAAYLTATQTPSVKLDLSSI